jgi:hypothetical protein
VVRPTWTEQHCYEVVDRPYPALHGTLGEDLGEGSWASIRCGGAAFRVRAVAGRAPVGFSGAIGAAALLSFRCFWFSSAALAITVAATGRSLVCCRSCSICGGDEKSHFDQQVLALLGGIPPPALLQQARYLVFPAEQSNSQRVSGPHGSEYSTVLADREGHCYYG